MRTLEPDSVMPKCPKCGNNRQVWRNQINGKLMCHRLFCYCVVEPLAIDLIEPPAKDLHNCVLDTDLLLSDLEQHRVSANTTYTAIFAQAGMQLSLLAKMRCGSQSPNALGLLRLCAVMSKDPMLYLKDTTSSKNAAAELFKVWR